MSAALGLLLGSGIVLVLSPRLWPHTPLAEPKPARSSPLRERLAMAGLASLPPTVFLGASALCALLLGAIALGVTAVLPLAVLATLLGAVGPSVLLRWRAVSRRRGLTRVWPDAVDHLIGSIRSGLSLPDSVSALSRVGPMALRAPFTSFERSYRATGSFSLGVDELKDSLADPTADRILETLRMAREVGGTELASVLRALSVNLREHSAVRAELEARQGWVTNAAKLGVAAPWIVLLLLSTRPEAAAAYNTPSGVLLIVAGAAGSAVAYRLMLAIGRLPDERRWFR